MAPVLSGEPTGLVLVAGREAGLLKPLLDERVSKGEVHLLDATHRGRLAFADGSISTVFCVGHLEYVEDIQNVLSELRRVMNDRSTMIVAIPLRIDDDRQRRWYGSNLLFVVESMFVCERARRSADGEYRVARFHKRPAGQRRPAKMVSIVIPVYNEVKTIRALLDRVLAAPLDGLEREVILVDDGSKDGTRELLAKIADPRVRVLLHERNRGKGAALRTGFAQVAGELVVVQDADLEYCPEEYSLLLRPLVEGCAQVVYGSRFKGRDSKAHSSMTFFIGGQVVTWVANIFFDLRLTDEPTCYKVFWADLLPSLNLQCERFEFCPEFTAKVARQGIPIMEVPISYHPRTTREGKKIGWRDGIEAITTLIRYRFSE